MIEEDKAKHNEKQISLEERKRQQREGKKSLLHPGVSRSLHPTRTIHPTRVLHPNRLESC
jgi:hypothetical protein